MDKKSRLQRLNGRRVVDEHPRFDTLWVAHEDDSDEEFYRYDSVRLVAEYQSEERDNIKELLFRAFPEPDQPHKYHKVPLPPNLDFLEQLGYGAKQPQVREVVEEYKEQKRSGQDG